MENNNFVNAQPELLDIIDESKTYLYEKLWELCAGPLCDLPKVGEIVYYFPQGHMELVKPFTREEKFEQINPLFELPSKLQCSVVGIDRKVVKDTDEVYAQITLMPDITNVIVPPPNDNQERPKVHSFTKVLTASDSRSQGGLTLLRKHAIECLPPLDMSQPQPSQIIAAKDLHGQDWSFKHKFTGTPSRHLLTLGWGAFVTSKRLVAGDAFIFLREETTGEMRVGIRRMGHQQSNKHSLLLSKDSMKHGLLASAVNAFVKNCIFVVVYKPRSSPFLVSYEKYINAMNNKFDIGSRFTMRFDGENFSERRYSGTVIGIKDFSPHWKDSEWRNLQVQWDESATFPRPDQVSQWEIEHLSPSSNIIHKTLLKNKRSRQNEIGSTSSNHGNPTLYQAQEVGQPDMSSLLNVPRLSYHDATADSKTSSCWDSAPTMPTPNYNSNHIVLPMKETIITNETTRCKLFGVDLTKHEQTQTMKSPEQIQNKQLYATRRCTKVQMEGVTLGRGVDLTVLNGYDQLIQELEELFDLKGELQNCNHWELIFADYEGDLMLVGDDPWPEFCNKVTKILICSKEEVKKMKSRKTFSQVKSTI